MRWKCSVMCSRGVIQRGAAAHLARGLDDGGKGGVGLGLAARVVRVEAGAGLLAQALGLVQLHNQVRRVGALRERVQEVLAHMQPDVSAHQIAQPAHSENLVSQSGLGEHLMALLRLVNGQKAKELIVT